MAAADPRQSALAASMNVQGPDPLLEFYDTVGSIPGAMVDAMGEAGTRGLQDYVDNLAVVDDPESTFYDRLDAGAQVLLGGFDAAPLAIGGAFVPRGAVGSFGGRLAAGSDLDALDRAERMLDAGDDPADIWRSTGWWKGPDDQWRFEIDDSGYDYQGWGRPGTNRSAADGGSAAGQASDFITHDALFAAYPELANSPTNVYQMDPGMAGAYYPMTAAQRQSGMQGNSFEIDLAASLNDKSIPLHELQHAVQDIEGFAPGGISATAADDLIAQANERITSLRDQMDEILLRDVQQNPNSPDLLSSGNFTPLPSTMSEIRRLEAEQNELMKFISEASLPEARRRAYRQLFGEVEARNVQARRDMTPEERRATPPWETMDIPEENWIVQPPSGGPSLSIDDIEILNAAQRQANNG